MITYVPLFVAIIGLIMYFAATNPKVQEVGRIMFAFGLLATLLPLANKMVTLLDK